MSLVESPDKMKSQIFHSRNLFALSLAITATVLLACTARTAIATEAAVKTETLVPAATRAATEVPPTATLAAVEPMRVVQGHPERTYVKILWSRDGRLLASYGNDNKVVVWDANRLEPVHTLTRPDLAFIGYAGFSPDGRWLAVGEARHVESSEGGSTAWDVGVWDLQNNTRESVQTDTNDLMLAAWNAEGTLLAYLVYFEGLVRFWAVPGSGLVAPEPIPLPAFEVESLRWQPDGTLTAAGVGESGWVLWRSSSPDTLAPAGEASFAGSIYAFSPDGSLAASLADLPAAATAGSTVLGAVVWDTTSGERRRVLQGPDFYGVGAMAISPDNAFLTVANHAVNVYANVADEVRVWDLKSSGVAATLPGGPSGIDWLAFSPNGKMLAAGEVDGAIRLWQQAAYLHPPVAPTPIPTPTLIPASSVEAVLFASFTLPGIHPDEPGQLNDLRWLDPHTLQGITLSHNFDEPAWQTTWQQRLSLYELPSGQVSESEAAAEQVREAMVGPTRSYSSDGSRFAYWLWVLLAPGQGTDTGLEVLDTATNGLLAQITAGQLGGASDMAWSPDGSRLAVQAETMIEVFEVASGTHLMTLENVLEQTESPTLVHKTVIWSPDGKWIGSSLQGEHARYRVILWDAETGDVFRIFEQEPVDGGGTSVDHIAFSPDGGRLLLVKGTVEVIDVLSGELHTLPAGTALSQFAGTGSWSADGLYVAVDYREVYRGAASVLIWNTITGEIFLFTRSAESAGPHNLIWAPDRPWLATVDGGVLYILDAERQAVIRLEPGIVPSPGILVWSPDGSQLAFGNTERNVEIWTFSE